MRFKINGKEEDFDCGGILTIAGLVRLKNLKPNNIVIEYNLRILEQSQWEEIEIKHDDNIEIVSFVGGG